jgi:ketosteroid isomerase-like protein
MADDKLTVARTFFHRYFSGDVQGISELLDPAIEYHVPGTQPPAGTFVGPEAVAEHLQTLLDMTQGTIDVEQWEDWLVGETHVAVIVRLALRRRSRRHNIRLLVLVNVSIKMVIDRVEVFSSEPESFSRIFGW